MDWRTLWSDRRITPDDAAAKLRPGQTLCVAMAASEPPALLEALDQQRRRFDDGEGLELWMCLPMRPYRFYTDPEAAGGCFVENWFYGAADRQAHALGTVSYVPNNLHQAASGRLHARGGPDVFWGSATPPDAEGWMSLSTGLIYEREMIERAGAVVLEVNEQRPRTCGDTRIHASEVAGLVEHHAPLVQLQPLRPSATEQAIGAHVAELIPDEATLQLGIGGIPNAIAGSLLHKRDLGVHTEMLTDGMVDLHAAGVITGRHKTLAPGKMVGGFALGTERLYRFMDSNPAVELQRGCWTNDPCVIGRNHKMISVNTALQVDLLGQVCSQSMGSRHFSGTGGQLDTHRGAQRSEGGRGIIALRSTARSGTVSTLVSQLALGAQVTIPAQDVDTVVTEYGVAELRGRSVKDRALALLRIAHPDFRAELQQQAERLAILPPGRVWAVE